ncbi:MAG: MMPL family transporter, partial [Deltaproteobacteria bacterium]|nr:MMPL family transporter [Deltaproteobacteria bacterium]
GTNAIIPGPTNLETLLNNPGEREAIASGLAPKDTLLVILGSDNRHVDDAKFSQASQSLVDTLLKLRSFDSKEKLFKRVETADRTMLGDENFISQDRRHLLIKADTHHSIDRAARELREIPKKLSAWQSGFPDFSLHYLSDGTINNEMVELINSDLDTSLIYTVPLTFLVLVWVFGSLVAAIVPLIIAAFSLFASLGVTSWLSIAIRPVSATASQLVVLLVLAVGIDYSLFIISRVREEVRSGLSYASAIAKATVTTAVAVFWSGVIVVLSLCGLFLMNDSVLASMAISSISSVAITAASAVLILPALLLCLKERIERGVIFKPKNEWMIRGSRFWLKIALNRPIITLCATTLFFMFLGSFAIRINLGSTIEPEMLPQTMQSRRAFEVLEQSFPDLSGTDFSLILYGQTVEEQHDLGELQPIIDAVLESELVRGPIKVEISKNGKVIRYHFVVLGKANDVTHKDLIERIRKDIFPNMVEPLKMKGTVGGTLPYIVDDVNRYISRTPIVFGAVVGVSLIFLLIVFRSVVVPLKALILNIFSTMASFGVLVIFFQISGIAAVNYAVIESFVPPLLFSILFGLSMDYHVFLLSRVYEESKKGRDIKMAVERGVDGTFRTITGAALIMVMVFFVIGCLSLPIMKELGLGLAVAVIIDATIIRSLLLPASMVLLGRWNWYLPKHLNWLPRVGVG